MPDREKVINGLEQCISADKTCFGCPYDGTNCTITLSADALALLKEQEADMIALKNAYKELAVKGSVIVRCKDCIYMEKMDVDIGEGDLIWCGIHEFGREIDYYCADGVKKDD